MRLQFWRHSFTYSDTFSFPSHLRKPRVRLIEQILNENRSTNGWREGSDYSLCRTAHHRIREFERRVSYGHPLFARLVLMRLVVSGTNFGDTTNRPSIRIWRTCECRHVHLWACGGLCSPQPLDCNVEPQYDAQCNYVARNCRSTTFFKQWSVLKDDWKMIERRLIFCCTGLVCCFCVLVVLARFGFLGRTQLYSWVPSSNLTLELGSFVELNFRIDFLCRT